MADGGIKKPPVFRDPNGRPPRPPPQMNGPKKPVPAYYQPKRKSRSCCRRCCCCFICFLFILILLLVAFFGFFYAWYQPKLPVFRFRPMEINRFNISAKPDGTAVLDSKITIRVEVDNPNGKLKIYYGETTVSLTADKETDLGSASLPAFKQPANNVTLLKFTAGLGNRVVDSTVALKLKDRVKSGQVVVNAAVKTKVGIGAFNAKIGMLPVNVNCGGVTLKQINDGNSSPKCTFNTLRWIYIK